MIIDEKIRDTKLLCNFNIEAKFQHDHLETLLNMNV